MVEPDIWAALVSMINRTWYPEDYWFYGRTWIKSELVFELEQLWRLYVVNIIIGVVSLYMLIFVKSEHFIHFGQLDAWLFITLIVAGIIGHASIKFNSLVLLAVSITTHILVFQFGFLLGILQFIDNNVTRQQRLRYTISFVWRTFILSHILVILMLTAKSF